METNSRRLTAALLFAVIFLSFQPASASAQGKRKRPSFHLPAVEGIRQVGRVIRKRRSRNTVSRYNASSGLAARGVTSARGRRAARAERGRGGDRGSARVATDSGGRGGEEKRVGTGRAEVGPIDQPPVNPQGKSLTAPKANAVMSPPTKPKPVH